MSDVPDSPCPAGCRWHAWRGPLWAAAGWLAAAGGAVSVAALPLDVGESLCGMWGCFPPLPPLLAVHLLWAVGLGAGVWAVRRLRPGMVRPAGVVLFLAALVVAGAVIGRDLIEWVEWVPAEDRHLWPLRVAHAVATRTDLPLAQGLAAGAALTALGRRVTRAAACRRTPPATCPVSGR
ncbi:MAG: hypothetical protein K2X87_01945 [Gemmataceae bacterium]|nr:hypothetical protein [Gemmataceae bacterium]